MLSLERAQNWGEYGFSHEEKAALEINSVYTPENR